MDGPPLRHELEVCDGCPNQGVVCHSVGRRQWNRAIVVIRHVGDAPEPGVAAGPGCIPHCLFGALLSLRTSTQALHSHKRYTLAHVGIGWRRICTLQPNSESQQKSAMLP